MTKKLMSDAVSAGKLKITSAAVIDGAKACARVAHGKGPAKEKIKLE